MGFAPAGELDGGDQPLPGIEDVAAYAGIGGAVVTLLLGLAVLGLALATRHETDEVPEDFRRFAHGMTAWLAGAVSFFLGIGLTAGLSLSVQGLLNRLQGTTGVSAPRVLQRVSFTWGVTAAVMLILLVLAAVKLWRRKAAFVEEFVRSTRPDMLWDIGCNTGDYAAVALRSGARSVVGFESDHGALDLAFSRAGSEGLSLLPLYLDAANPSPSQGWN